MHVDMLIISCVLYATLVGLSNIIIIIKPTNHLQWIEIALYAPNNLFPLYMILQNCNKVISYLLYKVTSHIITKSTYI